MIEAFRTDAHPPGERTEYWVEAVRQATTRFEIRPRDDTALCGSLWAASVGEIHVGHVDAGPQRMARTRTIISDESDAPLLLSLREAGSSVVAQGGRETLLTSGYLAVFDARRPFLRDFPGRFRQNVAAVPFQILDVPGSYLAALIGQVYPPTHYIGGILSSFVSRLAAAAESGTACQARNSTCSGGLTDVLIALAAHKGRLHRDRHADCRGDPAAACPGLHHSTLAPAGPLPGHDRRGSPHVRALSAQAAPRRGHVRQPVDQPQAAGSLPRGSGASRRGRLDGGRDRAEMGLRQPRALQPELSCRLRPVPWRVAPHGQRPTP